MPNIDQNLTAGEAWLSAKFDALVCGQERIEDRVIRIDERTRAIETNNAAMQEHISVLDKQVEKHSSLNDRVTKMETPYRVTIWLLAATGASAIGIATLMLTHQLTITVP